MNKILGKILDNYFSNKLLYKIQRGLEFRYLIDIKIKKDGNLYVIYVKNQKYNDKQYKELYNFTTYEAADCFIRINMSKLFENTERLLKEE